jgi:hypothetical protein
LVATKHIRSSPSSTRVGGWSAAGSGEHYAIESLLQQAAALALRAPELTVVFGERAAALAEASGSDKLWVRAESLVVSARVRLGVRADTVGRAVAALRAAEDLGETVLAAGLRTDLALCARSVGAPLTGLAALRPVLEVGEFSGAGKAAALCQLVGCLSQFGRKPELDRTLTEADRLCGADDDLDGDDRLLTRALVRVAISAHRRRHSDVMGAADAARTGLGLLEQLEDPGCDGGVVRVRLILQLVCSLLDRGDTKNAAEIAESVLTESARAASVAPLGWLRMAVATRVLLPSGSVEAAAVVLRDAVHSTDRHGLHALTARLWAELAHLEERLGRTSEAIECLHQSRAAEHVHARSRRQAMGLLAGEFGNGGHAALDLDDLLGAPAPAAVHAPESPVLATMGHPASGGMNGRTMASHPDAGTRHAERSASSGGHARPESDAAEHTMIIPRIVEPSGGWVKAEPANTPQAEHRMRRAAEASSGSADVSRRAEQTTEPGHGARRAEESPEPGREAWRLQAASSESGSGKRRAPEPSSAGEARNVAETAKPQVKLAPMHVERPPVPDLPLAPPPADEPAPRVSLVFERNPTTAPAAEEPEDERGKPKTRHDATHGSVAARSVLDRLGISAGSGGGRRRAADDSDDTRQSPESAESVESPGGPAQASRDAARGAAAAGRATTETAGETPASEQTDAAGDVKAESRAVETPEPPAEETSADTSVTVNDPWLPRLRLPPSLEPFEDFSDHALSSTSETHFTSTPVIEDDELGEPFRSEYNGSSPLDDDLPADAGLADLLARALAEHRAGTSSAAALVKRLGNQGSDERPTVNGHSRGGEPPANGRHRGGSDH